MTKAIDVMSLGKLETTIKALNRKLARRSIPAITIVSAVDTWKVLCEGAVSFIDESEHQGSLRLLLESDQFFGKRTVVIPFTRVTVDLPVENIGITGVEFVGCIETTSLGDRILHPIQQGSAKDLEALRTGRMECDHCGSARARKKLFVFRKEGKLVSIGRQCTKEYFGLDLADALGDYIMLSSSNGEDDDEPRGSMFRCLWERQEYLAACLYLIRSEGFRSIGKFEGANTSASAYELVRKALDPKERLEPQVKQFASNRIALGTQVGEIVQWYAELKTTDSFLLNCRAAILDPGYTRGGLLAAAVNAFFKAMYSELDRERRERWAAEKAERDAAGASTTYYGVEGKRITESVTVGALLPLESDFGNRTLVKMVTSNGSELLWFTSAEVFGIEIGHMYVCTGTVKKHAEYRGMKQTTLQRCKLEPLAA